jgi:hypothetical protein
MAVSLERLETEVAYPECFRRKKPRGREKNEVASLAVGTARATDDLHAEPSRR